VLVRVFFSCCVVKMLAVFILIEETVMVIYDQNMLATESDASSEGSTITMQNVKFADLIDEPDMDEAD